MASLDKSHFVCLVHFPFSHVTGTSCMTNVYVSMLFQKTLLFLHCIMVQSVKKFKKNKARVKPKTMQVLT